jgi:hypothetical protein
VHKSRAPGCCGDQMLWWHLIFVGPHYGTCFVSPFWCLELFGGSQIFRKIWSPPNHYHHHVAFLYLWVKGRLFPFYSLCSKHFLLSFFVFMLFMFSLLSAVHWIRSVVGLLACHFSYPKMIVVTYFCSFVTFPNHCNLQCYSKGGFTHIMPFR